MELTGYHCEVYVIACQSLLIPVLVFKLEVFKKLLQLIYSDIYIQGLSLRNDIGEGRTP